MDADRFTAMDSSGSSTAAGSSSNGSSGLSWNSLSTSAMSVNPCEAVASAGSWGYSLVGQCFSRMRRVQFDEEHQRSLLSCHSTEESYNFPDEAMLELRRRVLKAEAESHRRPTFAKDLEYQYPLQMSSPYEPKRSQSFASRWEKRKANALAMKQQQAAHAERRNINSNTKHAQPEFKVLLSDTEKALDHILGRDNNHTALENEAPLHPLVHAADVRRLSVDELLSLRSFSTASTCSTASGPASPEKTGAEANSNQVEEVDPACDAEDPKQSTQDAQLLREWLADIDPQRCAEYHAYARDFEKQGFLALEDLAELDEDDVEQAMSEIGISKFAHRARIRKSILRLRSDSFQNESSSSLMISS